MLTFAFGCEGAPIVICARSSQAIDAGASELRQAQNNAQAVRADVGVEDVEDDVESTVEQTVARCGRIDVLMGWVYIIQTLSRRT